MNWFLKRAAIFLIFLSMISIQSCKNTKKDNSFSFVQMCDPQLGMGGYAHDTIAFINAIEQINKINPDFVVICGDLVESANEKSFNDFIKIKSRFANPVYLTPGNHDVENVATNKSLEYYRTKLGNDYYSFDYKGYKFAIVNTQLWKSPLKTQTKAQELWFEKTLINAQEKKEPVIVVGHYPLFVERPDELENYFNIPIKKRLELMDLYQKYGVVAYLGGHVHKTLVHNIEGIQYVNGETTSMNFDNQSLGFRLWNITSDSISHKFIELAKQPKEEIQYIPDYQEVKIDSLKN